MFIFLDRDGVLNEMVIDPEHGLIDSPMNVDQLRVIPSAVEALKLLKGLGARFAIVTNQPAAAKGKTTLSNLEKAHARLISEFQQAGIIFEKSYICFHRTEDHCDCRKPKPGMLKTAFLELAGIDLKTAWMVGDGVTDVECGFAAGIKTAYLGPQKCDARKIFEGREPDFWGSSLIEFAKWLKLNSR